MFSVVSISLNAFSGEQLLKLLFTNHKLLVPANHLECGIYGKTKQSSEEKKGRARILI